MTKTHAMAACAGLAIAAAGCSADARTQIRIVGSSTVYPFTTAVAEQFKRGYPQFSAPIVEATGTGGGMKLFCSGIGEQYPDFTNASRRIKASEVKLCQSNGVTGIIELQVGIDGLAIAAGKNSPINGLTLRDIYLALAAMPYGKKNTARTWRDVNPKLPAVRIELIGPPPTSGTRDSFNELYMEAGCNTNPAMAALKKSDEDRYKAVCTKIREDGPYVEAGENDNLIVQKLASNPNALGAFGYSYFEENRDKLKDIAIDGVPANIETITSFKYPASRKMYIYAKAQHMRAVRGMREFLAEYSKETTWGPGGYLARRGMVPSTAADRRTYAAVARSGTLLAPGSVK